MSLPNIRVALLNASKTALSTAGFLPTEIRWPNTVIQTPTDKPWVTVDLLPGAPVVATLGDSGEDELSGIVQFGLYFPLQTGDKSLVDVCETLRLFFVAGKHINQADSVVRINSFGMSPIAKQDANYVCYVSVYWRSRANRPSLT